MTYRNQGCRKIYGGNHAQHFQDFGVLLRLLGDPGILKGNAAEDFQIVSHCLTGPLSHLVVAKFEDFGELYSQMSFLQQKC